MDWIDWGSFTDYYEVFQTPVCWRCDHVLTIDEYDAGDYCGHCQECPGCFFCQPTRMEDT
jgi:hypothetical protein